MATQYGQPWKTQGTENGASQVPMSFHHHYDVKLFALSSNPTRAAMPLAIFRA